MLMEPQSTLIFTVLPWNLRPTMRTSHDAAKEENTRSILSFPPLHFHIFSFQIALVISSWIISILSLGSVKPSPGRADP